MLQENNKMLKEKEIQNNKTVIIEMIGHDGSVLTQEYRRKNVTIEFMQNLASVYKEVNIVKYLH